MDLDSLCQNCKGLQDDGPIIRKPLESKNWIETLASVESKLPVKPRKVVCSYPITTMWSNVLGTIVICYAIISTSNQWHGIEAISTVGPVPSTCLYFWPLLQSTKDLFFKRTFAELHS